MHARTLTIATLVAAVMIAGCTAPASSPTTSSSAAGRLTTTAMMTSSSPTVKATQITVTSAPSTAPADTKATVCWHVEGTGTSVHTAVHYDTTSHPNATSYTDYHGGASYPNNGTSADPAGYKLPGDFCTGIPMPANGTLYFRAHVIADTHRLSDERSIMVQ